MAEIIFFLYKIQNGVKALQKANYKISHSDELNDDLRIHQATKNLSLYPQMIQAKFSQKCY